MVATELLKLAMETEEGRKERLKKMVAKKWALLDKDIEMEDSETENENRNGRTILHHTISLHYNVM